jgi:hypothetical protein
VQAGGCKQLDDKRNHMRMFAAVCLLLCPLQAAVEVRKQRKGAEYQLLLMVFVPAPCLC